MSQPQCDPTTCLDLRKREASIPIDRPHPVTEGGKTDFVRCGWPRQLNTAPQQSAADTLALSRGAHVDVIEEELVGSHSHLGEADNLGIASHEPHRVTPATPMTNRVRHKLSSPTAAEWCPHQDFLRKRLDQNPENRMGVGLDSIIDRHGFTPAICGPHR